MKKLFYVGLDVHGDTIVIAVARTGREPAMQLATIPPDEVSLFKVLDDLGPRGQLRVCYEARAYAFQLRQIPVESEKPWSAFTCLGLASTRIIRTSLTACNERG